MKSVLLSAIVVGLVSCVGFYSNPAKDIEDADGDADMDGDADSDFDADADLDGDADVNSDADGDSDVDPEREPPSDQDGDTISDADEDWGETDTDGDGDPDKYDLDSDNDGIPDADEAGDSDLRTPPVDSDSDGIEDFRDDDSDDDGIPDSEEARSPGIAEIPADTDGDGVPDFLDHDSDDDDASDMVEDLVGTDWQDSEDNPASRGYVVFVMEYGGGPLPVYETHGYRTDPEAVDVYLLIDASSGTFALGETLQSHMVSSIGDSFGESIRDIIPDAFFGVGMYQDYAIAPYGYSDRSVNVPFENIAYVAELGDPLTMALRAVRWTVRGGDDEQSLVPALHAIATGCGDGEIAESIETDPEGACTNDRLRGYPHFRNDAIPVVVAITNAPSHNGPDDHSPYTIPGVEPPTFADTIRALREIRARVVGFNASTGSSQTFAHLEALARNTGAVDDFGSPLVYDVNSESESLGSAFDHAFGAIRDTFVQNVSAFAHDIDEGEGDIDTLADFIEGVEVSDEESECYGGLRTSDFDGEGHEETFIDVPSMTRVCWRIVPRVNDSVEPADVHQVFRAKLEILGDNDRFLEHIELFFIVPR